MGEDLKVEVGQQIPGFVELMNQPNAAETFPNVVQAMNKLAELYVELWRSFASGTPIPGAPKVINMRGGSKYISSIQALTENPFVKIIQADGQITDQIEKGHEEIDIKPGLLAGPKARHGSTGPYNIVAFRHGSPGSAASNKPMPINVYNMMKKAEPSKATGTKQDTGGVNRQTYNWGGRAPKSDQGIRSKVDARYTWKTGPYSNMVKMQDVTSKAKSSQYITFRMVSTRSDPRSWIIPAVKGAPIRQAVIEQMRPIVEQTLKTAIERDLNR